MTRHSKQFILRLLWIILELQVFFFLPPLSWALTIPCSTALPKRKVLHSWYSLTVLKIPNFLSTSLTAFQVCEWSMRVKYVVLPPHYTPSQLSSTVDFVTFLLHPWLHSTTVPPCLYSWPLSFCVHEPHLSCPPSPINNIVKSPTFYIILKCSGVLWLLLLLSYWSQKLHLFLHLPHSLLVQDHRLDTDVGGIVRQSPKSTWIKTKAQIKRSKSKSVKKTQTSKQPHPRIYVKGFFLTYS